MRIAVALALASCGVDADVSMTEQATTVCGGSATVQGMDVSAYEKLTGYRMRPWRVALRDYRLAVAQDGF